MEENTNKPARSCWNIYSVTFNLIGIAVGLALFLYGGKTTYHFIDGVWMQSFGERKAQVIGIEKKEGAGVKADHYVTLRVGHDNQGKPIIITIKHQKAYEYIAPRYNAPHVLPVEVQLVKRMISRRYYVSKIDRIPIITIPKSAGFIIYMGIIILGGAIVFTSIRELRKRWLRRTIDPSKPFEQCT